MCKSSRVNRSSVIAAIKGGGVTGTDLRSCAVSVVAVIGAHPVHIGKAEEILYKLLRAEVIEIRDAEVRCVTKAKKVVKKKFDRSAARKQGRIDGHLLAPPLPYFPKEWAGIDPEEYNHGWVNPAGGWTDEEAVFDYHLWMSEREYEIEALAVDQFMDWAHDIMGAPACKSISQLQYA
ncbi:hypothetical protein B7Y94_03085 [Candidatus Saccharibacteria bacterium 32-49-12]|nr:MAG: hypothetical protein B7Y94_03085 [Candidatus Saccharibacteria bacterium 32-49-12]